MNTATHTLIGGLMGALFASFGGEQLIIAGMIGGAIPDLDMILEGHRKNLHFPSEYSIVALGLTGLYLTGFSQVILFTIGFGAAAIHSIMDIFAGAELRSWDRSEWRDKAVYDHLRRFWYKPRRIVVGGSKMDFLLSVASGFAIIYLTDISILTFITVLLVIGSGIYSLTIHKIGNKISDDHDTLNSFVTTKLKGWRR